MKKLLLVLLALPLLYGCNQNAEDYFNKALDYAENEQYQLAIDNYTKYLRLEPDDADAYNNRGLAYKKLENYKAAIADYTSALKINSDDAGAYKNRGLAKAKSGQSSCSDYKRACDLGLEDCCKWYKEDNCR
jgi:tetratricopeptide (TPR) repeat protein